MNNNIQESYCSFEVSKLLKEKGCDVPSPYWGFEKCGELSVRKPTHALAIEWIRVNFGYYIEINHDGTFSQFTFKVSKLDKKNVKVEPHYMFNLGEGFNSPQEATEAALLYILNNLI